MTGRDLAATRMAQGISQRAMADALGCNRLTLNRWELSFETVPPGREERWRTAFAKASQQRRNVYQRAGLTVGDIQRGHTLAAELAPIA